MRTQTVLALVVVLGGTGAWAQSHPGALFGARDPAVCPSRKNPVKGAPTVEQAKAYFYCDSESMIPGTMGGSGDHLYLVTDVKMEVAPSSRPFNIQTDPANDIDPKQPVYNIRGSYALFSCSTPGAGGGGTYPIGKNCGRQDFAKAAGMCHKDTFGDWHCLFNFPGARQWGPNDLPAPGR